MNITEHKILDYLKDIEEDKTINDIANNSGIDRHTAAKHLEMLSGKGLVEYRIIGKSKMWKVTKSPFLNALKNNTEISENIRSILQHLDGEVSIRDKNKTLWSKNTTIQCDHKDKKCETCSVDKTFKTGNTQSSTVNWKDKKVNIITQPIKDRNNNTVAVIEIIKNISKKTKRV